MTTNKQQNIKENIQELNRINQKIQREKNQKRKERTRRLIQKGALVDKYFDLYELTSDETEIFLKLLKKEHSKDFIENLKNKT